MSGTYICGAATHAGTRRRTNEDAYLVRPDLGLWVVADGMGGHRAGDVASRHVVEALDFDGAPPSPRTLLRQVEDALEMANADLLARARAWSDEAVMASTVVGLLVAGLRFACFWAGDSRAYVVRGGAIRQLTRDDSHVQDMIDAGQVSAAEADRHPLAHVVTAAVGTEGGLNLHIRHGRLAATDRFILCTDGLSRTLAQEETCRIAGQTPVVDAAAALVERAVKLGARDNVTAVVVGRNPGPDETAADAEGKPDTALGPTSPPPAPDDTA